MKSLILLPFALLIVTIDIVFRFVRGLWRIGAAILVVGSVPGKSNYVPHQPPHRPMSDAEFKAKVRKYRRLSL